MLSWESQEVHEENEVADASRPVCRNRGIFKQAYRDWTSLKKLPSSWDS